MIPMRNYQHLQINNISKFAVIVLLIVLLTGFALVPALQLGVNGQVQQQQQQQQQHLAFRQAPEESVTGEQTFSSAFDTFVSSESGDTS